MKLLFSALIGGILLFAWSSISWMVLPWHNATFKGFTNEMTVTAAMTEGSTSPGVYLLPNLHDGKGDDSAAAKYKGPFAFILWSRNGCGNMGSKMLTAFLENVLTAFVAAWLLSLTGIRSFGKRLLFVVGLGLFAALAVEVPNMIWWGFSREFTTVTVADLLIAWGLAGTAIAKIAP